MNKYLKLFGTKGEFKTCLEAKIAGDNSVMGFPNVSVIGAEDNNGNFSASEIHYIKDLTKAQAIREQLRPGYWVNPTNIEIISEYDDNVNILYVSINNGLGGGGYPENFTLVRFQPYDWHDKETNTTYYAFITMDAFDNVTENTGTKNVLDGQDIGLNLLEDANNSRFSDYDSNNNPPFHGKIIYVKDLTTDHELYEREFIVDNQGNLTFNDNINPFDSDGYDVYVSSSTYSYYNIIKGYNNSGSGSGSGSGDGDEDYSY